MYHCDVSRGLSLEYKRIVQWDRPLLTLCCLVALTVLIGFFHDYTLPVAVLMLLGVILWCLGKKGRNVGLVSKGGCWWTKFWCWDDTYSNTPKRFSSVCPLKLRVNHKKHIDLWRWDVWFQIVAIIHTFFGGWSLNHTHLQYTVSVWPLQVTVAHEGLDRNPQT